jgi:hypothetical protein
MRARRRLWAGMPMSKESIVVATVTGGEKVRPVPGVGPEAEDHARGARLHVRADPRARLLGAHQHRPLPRSPGPAPAHVDRAAVVPDGVEGVPPWGRSAVVHPDLLLVHALLVAGGGAVERPRGTAVAGAVGADPRDPARGDADGGGPGRAVRGPVHRGVGVERVAGHQGQRGPPPGEAAIERVVLHLKAAAADVVRRRDDPMRVAEIDPDVRLAAGIGRDPRDPRVRALGSGLLPGDHVRLRPPRQQVRMGLHPLVDLLEDQRITARGVRSGGPPLRVGLAPEDPQPGWKRQAVRRFPGTKHLEILMALDQPLESAARRDAVLRELPLHARPGTCAQGRQGEQQRGGEGQPAHTPLLGARPPHPRPGPRGQLVSRRRLRRGG